MTEKEVHHFRVYVPYQDRFKYLDRKLAAVKEGCEKGIPLEFWCDDCGEVLAKHNRVKARLQLEYIKKIKPLLDKIKGVV